jgi:hypothetical protein
MKKLIDVMANPSGFDSMANYAGDVPDSAWLVVMTRNRDSDVLTESNWECALNRLGDESDAVQVFRFGHWACGWWEALCVQAGTDSEQTGRAIFRALEDYPVLDEADFSEKEQSEADSVWRDCYRIKERIDYIRKFRSQFDFRDLSDLIACVRGEYFAGYASELLN